MFNNDIVTLERAIKERVFFVGKTEFARPPQPKAGFIQASLEEFSDVLARVLPSTTLIGYDEFVASYQGRMRTRYQGAVDSLMVRPVCAKDAQIRPFVKAEKGKLNSAPRVIQPRDPRYNVEVGRFLRPLEGRVYKSIARVWGAGGVDVTVMKGFNAHQVGNHLFRKWSMFSNPVAIGLDASRFDQHCSVDILRWEHAQYLKCFRNPDHRDRLAWLLSLQLHNFGSYRRSDGSLKYKTNGCRMSGDMNTALGNCLIMCALVWTHCFRQGVTASLANNGDDCVVFMEKRDLPRFLDNLSSFFLKCGFNIIAERPVEVFEQIEFCQAHPVFDGVGHIMVRSLPAFTKDTISLIPLDTPGAQAKWMEAIGLAGLSLTGGMPIWQDFYGVFLRSAKAIGYHGRNGIWSHKAMDGGLKHMADGMNRSYKPIIPEVRYSFWLAFGISPQEQEALEADYRKLLVPGGLLPVGSVFRTREYLNVLRPK